MDFVSRPPVYKEETTGAAAWYEFKVLLFARGANPAGVRARVSFQEMTLLVEGQGFQMTAPVGEVDIATGGYDGRQWMLSWKTDKGGRVTAMLRGEADLRMMRRVAPHSMADRIGHALREAKRRRRRFHLLAGLVIALSLLPLVLAGLLWVNSGRVTDWVVDHISLKQEQRLGELAFLEVQATLRPMVRGPAVAMVRQIGDRLTAGSRYHYHWVVANNPEVNAFAIPGGYIVVYTGLLRAADNADEVAGVLAHEIQHVEQRHTLKAVIHALGWRAVLAAAFGDISDGIWTDMAYRLGSLGYSRDLEREADLGGLKALYRAGIDPRGMPRFFEKLAHRDGTGIPWLSSHPTGEERMRALGRAIEARGDYSYRPLPYDWQAIQQSLPPAPSIP